MNPHFYFPNNFGALPNEMTNYQKCKIVILPIPYDATTTYKPGTRDGPKAIIDASRYLELYDEENNTNHSTEGICTLSELEITDDTKKLMERITEATTKLIEDGKKIITLGGEHSISYGVIKAHTQKNPNITVLHIDAHADMRDYNNENQYNHACVARRISELCKITSIGIRSLSQEEKQYHQNKKIPVFYAEEMRKNNNWMQQTINTLTQDVYITLDLDALDTSIMPSTGTPQPGGLTWYQITDFFKLLATQRNIIGFDITELAPNPTNHAPDFLAAKLTYKMLGLFLKS